MNMNRDRFCNIIGDFADSSVQDNTSLKKLNPFFKMLEDALTSKYTLSQKMSVDESLFIYKERLHFWQYIKSKRSRFGIKIFKLVDSNGVTIRSSSSSSFEGHPLQVRHKQNWGPGFILLLPQTAALPGSDAGSDVIKPTSSFVIQNRQTACSMWCPMYGARC